MASAILPPVLTPDQLREAVGRLPRVRLADLPTPLRDCPRLSSALGGPRILIKRDDLTGLAFGGNKLRNLEFRMAEAQALGADVMIAGLEAQSNSARQTTAAANILGMHTVLVLNAPPDSDWLGNMLIDRLLGAEVILYPAATHAAMDAKLREVAQVWRDRGHTPYVMNHAKFFGIGSAAAYILCTLEILEQLAALGLGAPDYVYMCSGSKGQAGLELAVRALGLTKTRVVGVSAHDEADRVSATARIASEAAATIGLDVQVAESEITNDARYVGAGYGIPSPGGIDAIKLVAKHEGVILDPVYSGKAMAGLIDHIKQGRISPDATVVFIHTGGTPALFAFKDELLARL
jgi:D-cysteine desulfhydrase/L-cysteate sulfo-lyase